MKFLTKFIAIVRTLLCFSVFVLIALVFFDGTKTPLNFILSGITLLAGIKASQFVYNFYLRRGGVISEKSEHYEHFTSEEFLVNNLSSLENQFLHNGLKKGHIRIWGDWKTTGLNQKHILVGVSYSSAENTLVFWFAGSWELTVKTPKKVFYSGTYFKVKSAEEVVWKKEGEVLQKYIYRNAGKDLALSSNTDWKPHRYDMGIGADAVYIQLEQ